MIRTAGLKYTKKIVINKDRLEQIRDLCQKYCDKFAYHAATVDGSTIEFESFEELIEYENYKDSKIISLDIKGHNNYQSEKQNRITISLGSRFRIGSDEVDCSYTFANPDDEIVFKQSLLAILEKCSDEQNTLLKGRILFGSLCSIINIRIAFKIFSGATLGKILCWTAVLLYAVYISYKIFDLLWTRLFPDIVFALGEEIQKEDQRNHLKTNVIWGILVASIVSILLACII